MGESFVLCVTFEMTSWLLQLIISDLSLFLIQGVKMLSLKLIFVVLKRYYNLTKDQRDALYSLNDDPSIIIKGTGKGSVVAVWDREDYLKEAYKQLDARKMYEEFPNNLNALINTIMKT